MNNNERQFEKFIQDVKFDDKPDGGHRDKLERDLLTVWMRQPRHGQQTTNTWRKIMSSQITKLSAAAVIVLALIVGITEFGEPIGGASAVFAAAIDTIREARTFSCIEIVELAYNDGSQRGTYLMKQKWIFQEPDRERHEKLTSAPPWPQYVGEVTIWHYGKRQQLLLRPFDKTAEFHDMSSDYEIDEKTGELKLTQLDTSLRDRLLEWSVGAVEDLGRVELDDRRVRKLQSQKNNRITTVWIDSETNYPVQIELKWTDQSRLPVVYTSIQIDTSLDDGLFSLEPPEGYALRVDGPDWRDYKKKMMTKAMHLGLWCMVYADNNNGQFPGDLTDIVKAGVVTEDVLNKVLAAPDEASGPPAIRYRKPNAVSKDRSTEIILYEIFDQWPQDGVVACFADSHCELIRDQSRFEQLIK